MTVVALAWAAATAACAQPGGAGRPPPAGATFTIDLLFPCLTHVEQGRPVADLPQVYRTDLVPAVGDDAKVATGGETPTAVWTSKALGPRLHLIELGPSKCVIQAVGLPVEVTLGKTAEATQRLDPPYVAVPAASSYWPVVRQTEGDRLGRHIVVRLEGAEPGAPGHASRFPLLVATVTSRPAP